MGDHKRLSRSWIQNLLLLISNIFLSNWRDLHFYEHFQLEISSKCDIKAENSSTLCNVPKGRKGLRQMGSNADTDYESRCLRGRDWLITCEIGIWFDYLIYWFLMLFTYKWKEIKETKQDITLYEIYTKLKRISKARKSQEAMKQGRSYLYTHLKKSCTKKW